MFVAKTRLLYGSNCIGSRKPLLQVSVVFNYCTVQYSTSYNSDASFGWDELQPTELPPSSNDMDHLG